MPKRYLSTLAFLLALALAGGGCAKKRPATKAPSKKDVTDVVDILLFLAGFLKNREESIRYLDMLLSGRSGLHDSKGRELFRGAFTYLGVVGFSGESAFRDILTTLFSAAVPGALHVRRLKASSERNRRSVSPSESCWSRLAGSPKRMSLCLPISTPAHQLPGQ